MARIALFVEIADVIVSLAHPHELLPGVGAAIARLQQRGVPVIALSDRLGLDVDGARVFTLQLQLLCGAVHTMVTDILITTPESPKSWTKPRPGLLLAAARIHDFDLQNSWLVGTNADDARAAGQAGCAGAVLVGNSTLPSEDLGIVVAQAQDLADAPRVMIPRNGGCWHNL
jgi:histidinol phosphatase-like enzyme